MEHLLLCETKSALEAIVERTFRRRKLEQTELVDPLLEFYVTTLHEGINRDQALDLHRALQTLIKRALYVSAQLSTEEDYLVHLEAYLPADRKLTKMLIKLLHRKLDAWRKVALGQRVSMPRYKSSEFRADLKCASSNMSRILTPTVIGNVKLETASENAAEFPREEAFTMEVNKSTLDALVGELGKVESWIKKVHKR